MAGGEASGVELSKVLKIGDWCLFDKYGVDGVFSRCFIFHQVQLYFFGGDRPCEEVVLCGGVDSICL